MVGFYSFFQYGISVYIPTFNYCGRYRAQRPIYYLENCLFPYLLGRIYDDMQINPNLVRGAESPRFLRAEFKFS